MIYGLNIDILNIDILLEILSNKFSGQVFLDISFPCAKM